MTYIVETDHGQHWKRHVDQIKSWMNRSVTESNPDSTDTTSDVGFIPDESQNDTSLNLPEVDDQLETDDSATNENRDESNLTTPEMEVDSHSEPQAEGRRYPVRVRQPLNYFK